MIAAACLALSVVFGNIAAAAEPHWSFQPVRLPALPAVQQVEWCNNAIDLHVLARLEREGISPSPETDRITLIRRVTLDLVGLPPTPEEVDNFLNDDRPEAYDRLVDRLLASPHYGERWARLWLDLSHYGDTDGHLTDQLRPVAWRYRDWLVRMLNANLPFDEFTIRQIAGDLHAPEAARFDNGTVAEAARFGVAQDHVLGTGFLRQTLSNREGGADLEEYRVEQIVDRTSLVGTIWLGLTVGCARCHDHKYDPLSAEEFYRLYAFFDNADEVNIDAPPDEEWEAYSAARREHDRRRVESLAPVAEKLAGLQKRWEVKLLHAVAHPGEDHVWDRQWELLGLIWGGHLGEGQLEGTEIVKLPWDRRSPRQRDDLLDYFLQHGPVVDSQAFTDLKLGEVRNQLLSLKNEFPAAHPTRAPVMRAALTPRQTYVHDRGDFRSRAQDVTPGVPAWLPPMQDADAHPTRLALARWIVSRDNPLTARVTVNRMWQEFFGRGLVFTSDDFGLRGSRPSHPELLDFLADEFVRSGWDVKHMHRLIVTSATYRQSSRPRPELSTIDPQNVLLAKQSSLRVSAETIRDAALAASGLLSRRLGGPSVFPPQHERVTMEAFGSNAWPVSQGSDRYRRGLYTFLQRTSPFAQAITFDAPSPQRSCTRRDRSNTPLQALTLLNDPVFVEMSQSLADRVLREGRATDEERVNFAMRLCLSRGPTEAELRRLTDYLTLSRSQTDERVAWSNLAGALLNLHEFITRD